MRVDVEEKADAMTTRGSGFRVFLFVRLLIVVAFEDFWKAGFCRSVAPILKNKCFYALDLLTDELRP